TRQFQGRQLNAEQLETLRQQREQVIGLRDLARDPAEFKKRTEELKNQLETQLEERRNEAIKQAKNAIRNIISKNFNHLATLYQSQEKEQEYKFFIDKALTLLREEDFNLSIFTSVANFYVSVGKNKQAMCLSNISQR
ncbi:MAG: hypothetical protein QNJ64_20005, partial [Crocosphaera sp.]|nr:hypothetical protein [Crocosphaera sp.]